MPPLHTRAQRTGPETLLATATGLLVFVLYVLTLAPTVLYYSPENYDSAHLQVVSSILGIPSYTGYPAYVMLAHLFTYLPVGEAAYRVNLASAVFAALAVAAVFFASRRLGAGRWAAAAGSLAFGLSQTFWSQAVIAEVYTLHILLTSLFLLTLLVWRDNREERYLPMAAFLGGLAMTNHLTSVFLLPAALVFTVLVDCGVLRRRRLAAKSAGMFALGLSPYLYLPARASMGPPLLGELRAGDPSTLTGFLNLVSGGVHRERMFVFGPSELPERAAVYAGHLSENLNPFLLMLAAAGTAYMMRRDRAALVLLGIVYTCNLAYALEYDIEDLEIYFIPTYLVLCLVLAVGAEAAAQRLRRRSAAQGLAVATAAAILLFAAVLLRTPATYTSVDRSGDYRGREIVETVAGETRPGATVLYHGRSLHYMQLVEGRRTDLVLEDPFYTADWIPRAKRALRRGPVYVLYPGETNMHLYREAGHNLVPVRDGMLYEVLERPT